MVKSAVANLSRKKMKFRDNVNISNWIGGYWVTALQKQETDAVASALI